VRVFVQEYELRLVRVQVFGRHLAKPLPLLLQVSPHEYRSVLSL
jgi:hypothetical protein